VVLLESQCTRGSLGLPVNGPTLLRSAHSVFATLYKPTYVYIVFLPLSLAMCKYTYIYIYTCINAVYKYTEMLLLCTSSLTVILSCVSSSTHTCVYIYIYMHFPSSFCNVLIRHTQGAFTRCFERISFPGTCHAGRCIMHDMQTTLNLSQICTKTRKVITRLR